MNGISGLNLPSNRPSHRLESMVCRAGHPGARRARPDLRVREADGVRADVDRVGVVDEDVRPVRLDRVHHPVLRRPQLGRLHLDLVHDALALRQVAGGEVGMPRR